MLKSKGFKIIAFVITILILVNFIGSFKFGRMDLTEEKIHSLSPKTIEILENDSLIKDELTFEIYLDGDLPPELRKLKLAIKEKLDEFRAYGGDKIYYEFIDPAENLDTKEDLKKQLIDQGLYPTKIKSYSSSSEKEMMVFGGVMLRNPRKPQPVAIQLLQPSSSPDPYRIQDIPVQQIINDLEYFMLEGIYKVTSPKAQRIGFLQGNGELNQNERFDISYELSKFHRVEEVKIKGNIKALDNLDALVVAKPTKPISDQDQYIIDQFIMRGGKVAWLIDPVYVNTDSLLSNGQTIGIDRELNKLDQQIFNYGARINKDLIIDSYSGKMYFPNARKGYNWYYYPLIETYREDNLIVNNVDPILLRYASSIDLLKNEGVTKTPLLRSSDISRTYKIPVRVNFNMFKLEPSMIQASAKPFNVVAAMLEGKFNSYFRNRMSQKFLSESGYNHLDQSVPTKMLVVSDGDLIRNEVDSARNRKGQIVARPLAINRDRFDYRVQYGNREFFVNAMESLLGTEDLIPLRSKSITQRPLNAERIKSERRYWQVLNVVIPIIVILAFGMFHFMIRRRKYTK